MIDITPTTESVARLAAEEIYGTKIFGEEWPHRNAIVELETIEAAWRKFYRAEPGVAPEQFETFRQAFIDAVRVPRVMYP